MPTVSPPFNYTGSDSCYNFSVSFGEGYIGLAPLLLGLIQIGLFFLLAMHQQYKVKHAMTLTEEVGFPPKIFLNPSYVWILYAFGIAMILLGVSLSFAKVAPVLNHSFPGTITHCLDDILILSL